MRKFKAMSKNWFKRYTCMPPELSGDRLAFDMLSFATAGKRVPSVSVGIKAMHLICMVDKAANRENQRQSTS